MPVVRCPVCATAVPWSETSRFRPFCSERCKLIDLGAWAAESYSIPTGAPDGMAGPVSPDPSSNE